MLVNIYAKIDRKSIRFNFLVMDNCDLNHSLKSQIEFFGGKIFIVPYYKRNFNEFYKSVKKIFEINHFDILHCHQSLVSIPVLFLGRKTEIKKNITHSHNPTLGCFWKNIIVYISHFFFNKFSDILLACSKQSGVFLFGRKSNFEWIPNPVDIERFKFDSKKRKFIREGLGLKNDDILLVNVGRYCRQKNQDFLLNLLPQVLKTNKRIHILFLSDSEKLLKKVNKHKLVENIHLVVGKRNVEDYLSASDVYVCPSLFEGLSLSLLEAQCNGIPCIFSEKIVKQTFVNKNITTLPLKEQAWINELSKLDIQIYDERLHNQESIKNSSFNPQNIAKTFEALYLQ